MIFVEDDRSYQLRKWDEHLRQRDEFYKKLGAWVPPARRHITDIIKESGDDPIRITTVANRYARETGHHWKSRKEREELKLQAFRIVGELIKGYFIERYRRNWVRWMPPDNPKRKAFERRVDEMVRSLPKPNI